jgi:hypothetical protein
MYTSALYVIVSNKKVGCLLIYGSSPDCNRFSLSQKDGSVHLFKSVLSATSFFHHSPSMVLSLTRCDLLKSEDVLTSSCCLCLDNILCCLHGVTRLLRNLEDEQASVVPLSIETHQEYIIVSTERTVVNT